MAKQLVLCALQYPASTDNILQCNVTNV